MYLQADSMRRSDVGFVFARLCVYTHFRLFFVPSYKLLIVILFDGMLVSRYYICIQRINDSYESLFANLRN